MQNGWERKKKGKKGGGGRERKIYSRSTVRNYKEEILNFHYHDQ
jgi:hypothetical protein